MPQTKFTRCKQCNGRREGMKIGKKKKDIEHEEYMKRHDCDVCGSHVSDMKGHMTIIQRHIDSEIKQAEERGRKNTIDFQEQAITHRKGCCKRCFLDGQEEGRKSWKCPNHPEEVLSCCQKGRDEAREEGRKEHDGCMDVMDVSKLTAKWQDKVETTKLAVLADVEKIVESGFGVDIGSHNEATIMYNLKEALAKLKEKN